MSTNAQKIWTVYDSAGTEDAASGVRAIRVRFPQPVTSRIEGAHVDVEIFTQERTQTRPYSGVGRDPGNARVITLGVQLLPPTAPDREDLQSTQH